MAALGHFMFSLSPLKSIQTSTNDALCAAAFRPQSKPCERYGLPAGVVRMLTAVTLQLCYFMNSNTRR